MSNLIPGYKRHSIEEFSGESKRIRSSAANREKTADKKTRGRVKIKIELIQDRQKRCTTFSKRKAGLMKKSHELATLTGSQVPFSAVAQLSFFARALSSEKFSTAQLSKVLSQLSSEKIYTAQLSHKSSQLSSAQEKFSTAQLNKILSQLSSEKIFLSSLSSDIYVEN